MNKRQQTIDLIDSNTQKVINSIKSYLPTLIHKVEEETYHTVGYIYENNDGSNAFIIQGSGFSELEAWKDAYDWVNKIGQYRSTDELQMF
jgi:hypothetical protein